ncbi:MAG: 16S rRNA (cytidine(1402)-2'-O)-methyltransferase [Clostridiales bacterium]|nr:16S rRNA (cytidine(1402)-2'-O)-methyltransferase [Clostridiales bacterium]
MSGTLYLVPTPIGNLGDFSPRSVETLRSVDFVAAEDTRVSLKLLNHLEIKKPLVSYYRHNTETSGPAILERLLSGESCALVTDAGTPAVSDPGEDLVALCAGAGVPVVAIPGPCALVTALAVSGLPTGRFTFEGFLAMNKKNRRRHLESLRDEERTMIFYEAPHKLCATLDDLRDTFGPERRVALCRELTKLHEEVRRTTLGQAADWYRDNPPRGEFVLVVEGCPHREAETPPLEEGVERVLSLQAGGMRLKDAARQAAGETGLSKNDLYRSALEAGED